MPAIELLTAHQTCRTTTDFKPRRARRASFRHSPRNAPDGPGPSAFTRAAAGDAIHAKKNACRLSFRRTLFRRHFINHSTAVSTATCVTAPQTHPWPTQPSCANLSDHDGGTLPAVAGGVSCDNSNAFRVPGEFQQVRDEAATCTVTVVAFCEGAVARGNVRSLAPYCGPHPYGPRWDA